MWLLRGTRFTHPTLAYTLSDLFLEKDISNQLTIIDRKTNAYTTSISDYNLFIDKDIEFVGIDKIRGIDSDNNGKYETLEVDYKWVIYQPGNYRIQGTMSDENLVNIEFNNLSANWTKGEQIITYRFDGKKITNANTQKLYLSNVAVVGPVARKAPQSYLIANINGGQFEIPDYPDVMVSKANAKQITIKNLGQTTTQDITVALYYGHPNNNKLIKEQILNGLAYQAEQTITYQYDVTQLGSEPIYVALNASRTLTESRYDNNLYAFTPATTTNPPTPAQVKKVPGLQSGGLILLILSLVILFLSRKTRLAR